MKSIKTVYTIGNGPSSSHTVGPYRAAQLVKERFGETCDIEVVLYGSLAFTGTGHGTKKAILSVFPNAKIENDYERNNLPHPNTMLFIVKENGVVKAQLQILSIGGGTIEIVGEEDTKDKEIYNEKNFTEIVETCKNNDWSLSDYAYNHENDAKEYLKGIWEQMQLSIESGLKTEGVLPGGLNISRKAKMLFEKESENEDLEVQMDRLIAAFSYAACEENNEGHIVVTAPTCGSCGVIPAVLYYMKHYRNYDDNEIVDALAAGAVLGNVIRTNGSISGAECGCQAEIGSACSMAACALAHLYKMDLNQIEYASEVAMEHHLGLTCDPIKGLVQIPCIERNAVAAMRAVNAVNLAKFLSTTRKISFDEIVATMYKTGLDMSSAYKETSHGGLASLYKTKK